MSFEPHNVSASPAAPASSAPISCATGSRARPAGKVVVLDALTYAGNIENLAGPRARSALSCSCAAISATRARCARCSSSIASIRSCTSRPSRTSIARSWGPTISSAPMSSARMRCSRRRRRCGSIASSRRRIASTTSRPTRSMARSGPTIRRSTSRRPYAPNSPYSASKAGSDHLVRAYHETYGLHTTVTNCSNNYGPYQFPGKADPADASSISCSGKPLPVYGDGLQVRDWLHVADHCEAIALALTRGQAGRGLQHRRQQRDDQHRDRAHPVRAGGRAARRAPGTQGRLSGVAGIEGAPAAQLIDHVRDRPGHDRRYAIDCRKAQRDLGYAPTFDLATGLTRDAGLVFGEPRLVEALDGPRLRGMARRELHALAEFPVNVAPVCRAAAIDKMLPSALQRL